MSAPDGTDVLAGRAEVVLDVAGALHGGRVDVPFELGEDRLVALAHDVGQDVEPAAVGHPDDSRVEPGVGRSGEDLVEDRDRRLGALDAEPLGADVLRGEELLERLGGVEAFEDAVLLLLGHRRMGAFDLALDPALLVGLLDVHVLDADRAAVRVAEHTEQVAEPHLGRAGDAIGEELAVEVPDREAVRRRIELDGRVRLLPAQRVEVGDQVTAHAVDADQLGDLHLLVQHRLLTVDRVDVGTPFDGLVRHPEGVEDVVVEAVLTEQQLVDPLEEQPRLGTLDDAVVVGARDGDDLGDAERRQVAAVGALELGRVVDGADADDDALAGHQARHRLHGADGAGVGQCHAGALEVGDGELVAPDLADDLLVGDEEAGEVEPFGVAEDGNDERASAVALVDVDRETHVDVFVLDESWLAVGALEDTCCSSTGRRRRSPARRRSR